MSLLLGKKELLFSSLLEEDGFSRIEDNNYIQFIKLVSNPWSASLGMHDLQLYAGFYNKEIVVFNLDGEESGKTNVLFIFKLPNQEISIRKSFRLFMQFLPVYMNLSNITYIAFMNGLTYRNIPENGKAYTYPGYQEDTYRFVIYCNMNTIYCTNYVRHSYEFKNSWNKRRNDFVLNFEYPEKNKFNFNNKWYDLLDISKFMKDIES